MGNSIEGVYIEIYVVINFFDINIYDGAFNIVREDNEAFPEKEILVKIWKMKLESVRLREDGK